LQPTSQPNRQSALLSYLFKTSFKNALKSVLYILYPNSFPTCPLPLHLKFHCFPMFITSKLIRIQFLQYWIAICCIFLVGSFTKKKQKRLKQEGSRKGASKIDDNNNIHIGRMAVEWNRRKKGWKWKCKQNENDNFISLLLLVFLLSMLDWLGNFLNVSVDLLMRFLWGLQNQPY